MQISPADRSPQWRPQGADLHAAGANSAQSTRPLNTPNPVESMDRQGQGAVVQEPNKPSSASTTPNRDWTTPPEKKEVPKEQTEPPKEPISKELLALLHSLWQASGVAVDSMTKEITAAEASKMTMQERLAVELQRKQQVTYSDPTVKRSAGV